MLVQKESPISSLPSILFSVMCLFWALEPLKPELMLGENILNPTVRYFLTLSVDDKPWKRI